MKKTLQLYFMTLYVKRNTLKLIKTKNNMKNQILATNVVDAKNPSSLRVKFDCILNDNGKQ